jgi:ATP-binding cassette subfamily G (WHITE) protein 2
MRDEQKFRRVSAYVLQDDLLFAHLTVFETLMLAANFYLPDELPDSEKKEVVMGVLTELGLLKAKDTIIGDDKVRGVSGGERKRANIAAQLICDPAVLFLDEPTSGLDSFQAQSVMEAMKVLSCVLCALFPSPIFLSL